MRHRTNQGRVVAHFRADGGTVCLVAYPDGSWDILRGGETVGTWGPGGTADCIAAFVGMGGFDASVTGMGVVGGQEELPGSPGLPRAAARDWTRDPLPGGDEYRFN